MTIANNIKTSLPIATSVKKYLKVIEDRFKSVDKSLTDTLMKKLTTAQYDGTQGIQDHILNMTNKATKLKALGINVNEFFLVKFILNSFPSQFGPFKIYYNTNKDKWGLNELTSMCSGRINIKA